ncbi:hypothetical protein FBU31_006412, partial [Coemansia sp. 'formosensis']
LAYCCSSGINPKNDVFDGSELKALDDANCNRTYLLVLGSSKIGLDFKDRFWLGLKARFGLGFKARFWLGLKARFWLGLKARFRLGLKAWFGTVGASVH